MQGRDAPSQPAEMPSGGGPGPLALVGSGEYLPSMAALEASLLQGRPGRYVQLATAAVPDGEEVVRKWERMGREQAERLGVEAVTLPVRERADAERPEVVAMVAGAGLVYLSGGHPAYLARTLGRTALWRAIVEAWDRGAALAGCSAGAMVMASRVPSLSGPASDGVEGLGLLPHLQVVPHFDRFVHRAPDLIERVSPPAGSGVVLAGVDEGTAMVGGPVHWTVRGQGSVWLFAQGRQEQYRAGSQLTTPARP